MKISPVGTELFLAEGHTKRHEEANSHFSQFCEKPIKTITIDYFSNKNMLQFETCK